MGHIMKFLPPGSVRIGVESTGVPVVSAPMEATAFITPKPKSSAAPSQRIVVVVLNRDIASHKFSIHHPMQGQTKDFIQGKIPAHAIQTYLFKP